MLGGAFKYFFMFTPILGEDWFILTSIFFQMGWIETNHQLQLENGPFEDEFPIENRDIPASYVSLPEGTRISWFNLSWSLVEVESKGWKLSPEVSFMMMCENYEDVIAVCCLNAIISWPIPADTILKN